MRVEILNCWKPSGGFLISAVNDLFNDRLNYAPQTFDELVKLNSSMLAVALKYEMFGETNKAREELVKFKNNFEIIQVALGELEQRTQDAPSEMERIASGVKQLNTQLKQLQSPTVTIKGGCSHKPCATHPSFCHVFNHFH